MPRQLIFLLLIPLSVWAWGWQGLQWDLSGLRTEGGLPQASNLVFKADLTASINPEVGTAPTFTRASSMTYYSATSGNVLSTATSGNPCIPAFPWGGSGSSAGLYIGGERKNFLQYSEDWTQSPWANWGSGSFTTASVTTPDGATGGMDMKGDNGSGRRQDTGITATSGTGVCSVFLTDQDASADMNHVIKADLATEETTQLNLVTTSSWVRSSNPKVFTGAAGGTIECRLTQDDTVGDDWYGFGAMGENPLDADYGSKLPAATAYIKTTGATGVTARDNVQYQGAEWGDLGDYVSLCVWFNVPYDLDQSLIANTIKSVLNEDADAFPAINLGTISNAAVWWVYPTAASAKFVRYTFASFDANTWYHLCAAIDYTVPSVTGYVNGSAVSPALSDITGISAPTWSGMQLGGLPLGVTFEDESLDGLVGRIRFWKTTLTAPEFASVYNAEKGFYQ